MFWTVHNSPGAPQKVPAVATDRWRPAASRGLLTSDCEAVISQCWTCSGYWQLSSSHLWKVRASGVEQTEPKANALADMVLHWGKHKFDSTNARSAPSVSLPSAHTPVVWVSGKGHNFLAKPVDILKVRCAWRLASHTLFFRPPWMPLILEMRPLQGSTLRRI